MKKAAYNILPGTEEILKTMGEQIKLARLRRSLSAELVAERAGISRFTKQDIRELCPSLSISSVEGALRKMVAAGELKREGNGKSTGYIRLM